MKSILPAVIAAVLVMGIVGTQAQQLQKVTLNYPTRSGASWPLFIAREGGYYEKQGLDATLVFAGHPAGIAMVVSDQAQMSSYNLESVMQASSRGDAPFAVVG
ncbi:MAG TPA: ABC transporter substrate-binding protein, partial [Vicinamibacterales bacterium]|nr:ABC transporter substrate-binding protein [Vicinamibacterales bacterium]